MNQGYAYKVVNKLPGMEKEDLKLGTKVRMIGIQHLLHQDIDYFCWINIGRKLAVHALISFQESQLQLLQQVLAASDADADEEDVKGEDMDGTVKVSGGIKEGRSSSSFYQVSRRESSLSSMAGASSVSYSSRGRGGSSAARDAERHPLFKRFRQK